ncbi:serine-rich adhesin for platelets isoform X4 [Drosophila rhopaloa]|uniref:Protein kinase domain-containing protein n=1 Tax=Drosophila rhopaloa TaxID=1041015 RepID=A0ABM5GUH5_DRORH|nr:serine-rich adhesin for platelets isoform X4 [Drosophila rhopaloa]
MVIIKPDGAAPNGAAGGAGATSAAQAAAPGGLDDAGNSLAHPSGIPQDQIDNILSGIANTGNIKMNNHRKKLRQRFDIIKKLGQGTYGKVQLGINKETGQEVAIKIIKKCKIEAEADLVRIRREVQIMSSVHHPNIIHIYEVFENRDKMVLVMEFAAGGELYDYLSERKVLTEEEARRIFRQVATAVYYCHKHKICHRDLKLENILLDEKGNAKIADFGLSNVFDDQRLLGTFCGSPLYASPEIVEGTPYQGPEVDCWSLGVLLYTLVYGSMPFDGSNFKRLVKQISQGDYYEPRKPSRASTLIRDMLTVCPRKRASIEQICSHWWVNENDNVSCLDLAEDLANQTPVRLDVLLSLTPATITADQLVVPSAEGAAAAKAAANERVPRSHSVGSIRDMGPPNTEAERRILDMVAAGGEAALMPSPTRTITPAQSPVQTKRKLQPTVSTENAAGTTAKKKEKPANSSFVISKEGAPLTETPPTIIEPQATLMEAETIANIPEEGPAPSYSQKDMQLVGDLCEQLMGDGSNSTAVTAVAPPPAPTPVARQATRGKLDAVVETPEEKDATKVIKKFVNKHKTADLVNAINESASKAAAPVGAVVPPPFVRKCSLQDESTLNKFNAERRKSRILETAEKFQPPPQVAAAAPEKPKKLSIPGVSVGSFKKEFEKKATNPPAAEGPTPGELRAQEQVAAAAAAAQEAEALGTPPPSPVVAQSLEASDSKNSVASISLDEARRSMENSIALLLQAQNESSKEVDQLCAQTETIGVSEPATLQERERKLKNARAIIGNAIQPASPGVEGPPTPPGAVKTSTASITLKSATLPRRKINAKAEVQLDIKPRIPEQGAPPQPAMRFSTEMQHPVADLRSAPPREGPIPYSPIKTTLQARATSLEPKEHVITIQRPPTQHAYGRTSSNTTTRSGSLSRQSTVESESDATTTATNMSQATITSTSQPIKKSPREFIIPIAVEGGGFITPRERSVEPSESSHTTSSRSTFTRLRPSRRIGSLLSEAGFDEGSPFQKMRTTSINRDGVSGGAEDEARFTPHRLRSSRPVKKISQENDSQSSNEEDDDDDDGFEILTAESLFSTLLQRVRKLTNRLNVNSDLSVGFPSHSSRLLTDISRQAQSQSPFWSQGSPFASVLRSQVSYTYSETVEKKKVHLNSSNSSGLGAPWRHSMSRELGNDMESMFSRTGATLPRGHHQGKNKPNSAPANAEKGSTTGSATTDVNREEPLDLADLDLSRLRLSKKDLETLSSITPGLPKCFQEQLLAKLPPTQARKLSRTLSVQTSAPSSSSTPKVYKRSQSGGRGYQPEQQPQEELLEFKPKPMTDAPKTTSASTAIYRRSLSRSQAPTQTSGPDAESRTAQTSKSRSSSVCRDDYGKSSLCSSTYTSDISEKYKYYSPYLSKSSNVSPSIASKEAAEKRYSGGLGRPPSGCLSPPPQLPQVAATEGTSSLRIGRSSQRRISRFLRPDFFDDPRDRETQSMLREIREKSIDRQDQDQELTQDLRRRKHSLPNVEQAEPPQDAAPIRSSMRHSRKKSMELFTDAESNGQVQEPIKTSARQRSVSRARELEAELDKHELADKILQELQLLSAVRTQHEQDQQSEKIEETSTIKKVKKLKPKDSSANEPETTKISATTTATTTTLVRKVKKVTKKTDEAPKTTASENADLASSAPKETKLKRPKSYPMKDVGLSLKSSTDLPEPTASLLPSKLPSKLPSGLANESSGEAAPRESRLMRPKSYPATKLATPKELRKVTRSGVAIPTITEAIPAPSAIATPTSSKSTSEEKSLSATPTGTMSAVTDAKDTGSSSSDSRPTTIKKIIKVTKKSKLMPPTPVTPTTPTTTATNTANTTPVDSSKESSPVIKAKEKSPEKKPSKGLLYALGQKFEKLRDSAMSKEKKTGSTGAAASLACTQKQGSPEERSSPEKYKKKVLEIEKSLEVGATEDKRVDKRSRFDTMLRSLRERSVPRSQPNGRVSPKRAASVEELHAGSQEGQGKSGGAVNKMFGGFLRRFDRESSEQRRVRSTRSTSNIERQVREEKDRQLDASLPTSPIYQNVVKATKQQAAPTPATEENCNCETACPDCRQNKGQDLATTTNTPASTSSASSKEKRKGLMLDLASANGSSRGAPSSVTTATTTTSSGSRYRGSKTNPALINGNGMGLYSNLPPYPGAIKSASSNNSSSQQSMENATNNNSTITNNNCSSQTSGYRTSSAHEINRNNPLLTPSFENIANYSSDSRSYQDDCASTSTFLSPTEEPELYFDNWSICSEDNYMLHATPSPTVSRLSRASLSSPTRCSESSDPNESVIDRIKRRSFYSRFNEQKKPRRTSSIVGPSAVRDYYREQQAAVKARSSHKLHAPDLDPPPRAHSPDIAQQFFRPLKLSPVGTELKPPVYRSPLDYSASSAGATSKPRKSLNDIRNTSPSFLSKRYETSDYSSVPMRYKSSSSSSPSNGAIASGYYNTYNPKRRSSYTLNGSLPTATSGSSAAGSSHLDGYATLGRRSIRPYDHRTMSLLEPPTSSSSRIGEGSSYQRRETRTPVRDYTSSISRSGSRYRTSSATRSPTNI